MASTDDPPAPLIHAMVADTLKVETREGDPVGSIHALLVHKGSGRTTHAVLSLGGFLGMGRSYYPLPFALLHYDPVRDLYVVTVERKMLEGGPSWASNPPQFDQPYADRVARYYGTGGDDLATG